MGTTLEYFCQLTSIGIRAVRNIMLPCLAAPSSIENAARSHTGGTYGSGKVRKSIRNQEILFTCIVVHPAALLLPLLVASWMVAALRAAAYRTPPCAPVDAPRALSC